jgi:hypothetical protein
MRMCIDFTDLNKACPKDPFPLPCINQIVDSMAGCDLFCFLDAFSGYHQIKMAIKDKEKTVFITLIGYFCYTCMPFGLKNAGATFHRVMRKCLGSQIGRNVEAYIDDIVVKSRSKQMLIDNLRETFTNLRQVQLKLNPEKCTFGVPSRKLLGYLVSHRGIEANLDNIKAIDEIKAPRSIKDIQCLNGCITALGCFISRLGEHARVTTRIGSDTKCNTPTTPWLGPVTPGSSLGSLGWPHRPTLVSSTHFVLTRAHPGIISRSVTHPQIAPGQARLT